MSQANNTAEELFSEDNICPEVNNKEDNDEIDFPQDIMGLYMRNIKKYPLFSEEQENEAFMELIKSRRKFNQACREKKLEKKTTGKVSGQTKKALLEAKSKLDQIKNHIVNHNLGLVIKIAKRFRGNGLDLLDRIQEGNIGLKKCLKKYHPGRGYELSTYAYWWIRQSISRAVADKGYLIRQPVHVKSIRNQMKLIQQEMILQGNNETNIQQLAKAVDTSEDMINHILQTENQHNPYSLESPIVESRSGKKLLFREVTVDSSLTPEEEIIQKEQKAKARELINTLSGRELDIIRRRYGINESFGTDPESLEKIAKTMNITRERIRQIQAKTLKKIRKKAKTSVSC